jgi:hypothetical protein
VTLRLSGNLKVDAATVADEPLGTGGVVADGTGGVGDAGATVEVGVLDGMRMGGGVGATPQAATATAMTGPSSSRTFMVASVPHSLLERRQRDADEHRMLVRVPRPSMRPQRAALIEVHAPGSEIERSGRAV